ncbi:MAG: hypothetical protein MAG795_00404 [Candidatus Woesearchaeota archaeon]|nr:hypothetical protein [Candidatus Woesearchaeota archaeon]
MKRGQLNLKTDNWSIDFWLDIPIESVQFQKQDFHFSEPAEAMHVRNDFWLQVLLDTQQRLNTANGGGYYIDDDMSTGGKALYLEDGNIFLWDGNTISPTGKPYFDGNTLWLYYAIIKYSAIVACKNPQYADAFETQQVPSAGLELDVLIQTTDGIVFSERGIASIYSSGWKHPFCVCPDQDPIKSLILGLENEIGLTSGQDYSIEDIQALAYGETIFENSAHDRYHIFCFLQIDMRSYELKEKFQRSAFIHDMPVIDSSIERTLHSLKTNGSDLTPAAKASIACYFMKHPNPNIGIDDIRELCEQGYF